MPGTKLTVFYFSLEGPTHEVKRPAVVMADVGQGYCVANNIITKADLETLVGKKWLNDKVGSYKLQLA